jgi:hypothetical protein
MLVVTLWFALSFSLVDGQGFVLGFKNADLSSVFALQYGRSSSTLVLNASSANVTGTWVDFESQTLFAATRTSEGSGNILRVSYTSSSSRAIYW